MVVSQQSLWEEQRVRRICSLGETTKFPAFSLRSALPGHFLPSVRFVPSDSTAARFPKSARQPAFCFGKQFARHTLNPPIPSLAETPFSQRILPFVQNKIRNRQSSGAKTAPFDPGTNHRSHPSLHPNAGTPGQRAGQFVLIPISLSYKNRILPIFALLFPSSSRRKPIVGCFDRPSAIL
ncbi:hypothetical protein [Larkinella ripae]